MLKKFSQKEQRFYKISIIALSILIVISLLPSAIPGFKGKISPVNVVQAADIPYAIENVALNPGRNETELNFTWLSPGQPAASIVQMAKKADMTGSVFPAGPQVVTVTGKAEPATTVTDSVYYSNKATVTGLTPKTKYVYRVGDGTDAHWSPVYDFATQDPTNYTIMFVGDPQIGAGGDVSKDTAGWAMTLKQATSMFPNYSFIMSAGDQIENRSAEGLALEYDGFQSPDVLKSLPLATVVGNHDVTKDYEYHYNVPNESDKGTMKDARNTTLADPSFGGDYYYTYGDTLFMVLNTNNSNGAEHAQFMQETVAKEPDTKWRIVTFHHDIYGAGKNHSTETYVLNLRAALFPTLDALDVDMIFMGHDHSYIRTVVMNGDNIQGRQLVDSQGRDVNPNGNTYITANSASGSKYYELNTTPERYSASRSQLHTPTFSTISITPNSISVDTFRSDTLDKLDTYGFVKEPESVKVYAKEALQPDTNSQLDYYYAMANANAVKQLDTAFNYDSTKIKFVKAELVNADTGTFDVDTATAGVVNIKADLATPFRSTVYGQYEDVIKLTFEKMDKQNSGKASVQLAKSALTTENKHAETASTVEVNTADIMVGVPTTGVKLDKTEINLLKGESAQLTATVNPENPTNKTVSWTSSNGAVATVDPTGKVTAKAGGTATITVTTIDGGLKATSVVTVTALVTGVELDKTALDLQEGASAQLTATVKPEDATNKTVSWTSSSTSVATVDSNGKVTAKASGTATITVTTADGSFKATSKITVFGSTGTPSTGTPSTGTPSTGTPSTGTPSTGTPSTDTPSTGTPSTDTPSTGSPSTGTPSTGTPSTGTPSTGGNGSTTNQFKDVPAGYWAAAAINDLVSKQILNGTSGTTFEPQRSVTRAEFTAMLVRALELTEQSTVKFTDVKSGDWYADAVAAAVKAGIVQGTSATQFGANAKITREEMVTMLMRGYEKLHGKPSVDESVSFKDQAKFSSWAAAYIKEAAALGLVGGREEGVFQPAGITTRGEAAQVIFNLLSK
ncbi:S-layer homology domain-containing protein [Paenibacillus sepulcri]|uniref:S-layer homology domain-containing protein n=1 Tax=Paenibacillus sepulcri TaxID=359917 RepID=A0ABS7BWR4_9BACL|nr:S-layer homology domain-containing protein [Paenibacillus sepulcri]